MNVFIDRAKVEVKAGNGGNGMIAFHTEKYISRGGPSGGNGGRGGSVIFKATTGVTTLINFRHSRVIHAKDGGKGLTENKYGRGADDIIIEVPIGTMVFEGEEKRFLCDLDAADKEFVVAKGGRGGRGNACFKSSLNRTPRIAENGLPGEHRQLTLELKLLADVGFVGFPSVGKSTLLSVISAARPEIADYPFTTIIPNLGVVRLPDGESFVAADLPGLIEGAHQGKGLGLQFLRHIERCRVIIHIVDMASDRDPFTDFLTINKELGQYDMGLLDRPMIIACSKMDDEGSAEKFKSFRKKVKDYPIYAISALTHEGIEELLYKAYETLQVTEPFQAYDAGKEEGMRIYEATDTESDDYEIVRKSAHTYVITGERVERTYSLINLSTDEGMMKLIAYLRRLGVDDRLRKMGAKDGDTVILCDFEFEYIS